VIESAITATWKKPAGADYAGEVQRTVDYDLLAKLLELAANPEATPQVRAVTTAQLTALREWLIATAKQSGVPAQQAHLAYGARLITQYFEYPKEFAPLRIPAPPPGSPIGCDF
jgi:hypothetical protein